MLTLERLSFTPAVFAEKKNTSSIMTRHRFCERVFDAHDSSFFGFVSALLREPILRKRSYDIAAEELLVLCADNLLYNE